MTYRLTISVWSAIIGLLCISASIIPVNNCSHSAEQKGNFPKVDTLEHKNYVEEIPGTKVKFEMIAVPGGEYLMGSPATESGHQKDETPQHPVALRPFWIGKFEVRWEEYDLYWRTIPGAKPAETEADKKADAVTRPTKPYGDETRGHGRTGHPVLCITHHAAMEYCRWLSAKTGKIYRLPTEAEWEWAARAGTTTAYFFGDDAQKLDEYAWYDKNSDDVTHKVGEKKANPWGLHDVYGNVSEWCVDHYFADAYSRFPLDKATLGPVFPPTEKRYSHVVRGGSWIDPAEECRSAARMNSSADWLRRDPQRPQSIWWMTDADFVGFRVVRPVEEYDILKGLRSKVTRESE